MREFLILTSLCRKPSTALSLAHLLEKLQRSMQYVADATQKHSTSEYQNHLKTVSEGVSAAGWVAVENKPGPYIKDMIEASQYYGNRVVKDWKGKEDGKLHLEWARGYVSSLNDLHTYVTKFFATGLQWNPSVSRVFHWVWSSCAHE